MSSTTVYLLPEGSSVEPKAYGARVKAALLKMGVIGKERYDDEPNWYVAGPNSNAPFKEVDPHDIGFEYCIVMASPNVAVVPQDPAVEPRCPHCGADVSALYNDLVNDIETAYTGRKKSQKYLEARLACPRCDRASALPELRDEIGIFLSGTWVNFEETQSELRDEWLATFNDQTGWRHRALTYGYT